MEQEKILVKNMEKKITADKRQLRKSIISTREKLLDKETKSPTREKQFLDECITQYLILHEMKQPCGEYLCYISYKSEVDTKLILNYLLSHGKKVYVPKVIQPKVMEFFQIESLDELICGYQNIPEPSGDITKKFIPKKDKLYRMLIPGSVFDRTGNRMGYGGGFYDTYLHKCMNNGLSMEKIALAYELQVVNELPKEPHDVPMDFIYTEKGNIV
ncbi:MAG: 5-formyltetrahydrofolate cyclo-ligase [Lachnospiraceae bacterium]|nr:5-formyltetrahydrofolate cyclo-ligase [Lachnospiraceae bacterium]